MAGVLAILFTVGQTVFMFVDRHVPPPAGVDVLVSNAWNFANVFNNATNLAGAVIRLVLASKLPENRIGWLFLGAALAVRLSGFSTAYAFHALVTIPGSLPAGRIFAWEGNWVGLMSVAIATLLFLLFPTGHPRSRLWAIITTAVLIGWAVTVSTTAVFAAMSFDVPFALPGSRSSASTLTFVVAFAVPVLGSFVAALAGMISRFRHSTGDERLQLKWFAAAVAFLVVAFLVGFLSNTPLVQAIQDLAVVFLLAAVAIAVEAAGEAIEIARAIGRVKYDTSARRPVRHGARAGTGRGRRARARTGGGDGGPTPASADPMACARIARPGARGDR